MAWPPPRGGAAASHLAPGAAAGRARRGPATDRAVPQQSLGHAASSPSSSSRLDRLLHSTTTFSSAAELDALDGPPTTSQWSEEMPQAILFPANKPSSRADALILDQWVSSAFANYAQRSLSSREDDEDLSRAVEELVPILSIGLHEIVRQVTQHCLERGVVLEKIWRTYVDLFERALEETRASLRRHKERTRRVEGELARVRKELSELQAKHPEQIEKLSKTLVGKFAQRQDELEDQLQNMRTENAGLQKHMKEQTNSLNLWFPLFNQYKGSQFRRALQQTAPLLGSSSAPEARISADFQRILSVMPPEGRRRVGYYVSSLLGLRGTQLPGDSIEALTERREHNRWKIEQLEARLLELQGEVANGAGGGGHAERPAPVRPPP